MRAAEALWYLGVFAAIVGLAVVELYRPFNGDTALFLLGAQEMAHGKRLYVEFWDNKQPAIFAFFYVAGELFGYSERGVHLLELLWVVAFSLFLCVTLRTYFRNPWLSGLVPLCLAVTYYVYRQPAEATQLEFLVGFPTFASAWLLLQPYRGGSRRIGGFAAAGALAAVVVCFKLILAPMFVVFVLLATVEQVWRAPRGARVSFVLSMWPAFTVGVAATLIGVAAFFATHGTLNELLWTTFVYPTLALEEVAGGLIKSAPIERLMRSGAWYLACFAPLLPVIVVAVWRAARSDEPALTRLMIAWLIVGLGVIVLQRFSWWTYHLLLLFVPTAVLGVRGIDVLLTELRALTPGNQRALAMVAVILCLPPVAAGAVSFAERAAEVAPSLSGGEEVSAYQQRVSEAYRTLMPLTQFLREPDSVPGDIYVFGSPLIYLFSGRGQALPVHGWAWGMLVESQWQRLPEDIGIYRPAYIFVDRPHLTKLLHRNPAVLATIDKLFDLKSESEAGRWYQRRRETAG